MPNRSMKPGQRFGRPPIGAAQHVHERRNEHDPHQRRVHQHRQRQADAEHPHERHLRGDQRGERDRHHQRGGGHHPAGAGQAQRDAFVVVGPGASGRRASTRGCATPGTPRSPSTAQMRCRTTAPACWPPAVPVAVVPNAPRCPSWKIHTSAPNAAVSDKHVEQQCLQRQHHAAGQQKQQHERDRRDHAKRQVAAAT